MQRRRRAERQRPHLILGVLAHEDRARDQLLQAAADHSGAVAVHHDRGVPAECARQRMALLRLDDQKIGIAELIMLIPERHSSPTAAPR